MDEIDAENMIMTLTRIGIASVPRRAVRPY